MAWLDSGVLAVVLNAHNSATPDPFYDPPDEPEPCIACDGEGCIECDVGIAADHYAETLIQRARIGQQAYDEIHEAFKEAGND